MAELKVGFVGAGNLARQMHYPSVAEIEGARIVAACDLDEQRLDEVCQKYGIEHRYTDYRKMLDEQELDAVFVILRPHHLFDVVADCLERKLPVFTEKPLGVTSDQARHLARLAEENGVPTMVGFNRRFIPVLNEAKRRVEQGGEIIQAVSEFYKLHSGYYYRGAVGVLESDIVHAIDTLRYLVNDRPARNVVSAVGRFYARVDNAFCALVEFEGGAIGVLLSNWAVGGRVHRFEVHSKGVSAYIDPETETHIIANNGREPEVLTTAGAAGSEERRINYGFAGEDAHFIRCLRSGTNPRPSFADAVHTWELVDAVRQNRMS